MPLEISPEMYQRLKDILQKEAFLQLSEQMKYNLKKNNMREKNLYNPISTSNGFKSKTDRNKFHSDFLRAWNLKITSHNPMLFQPSFLNRLQQKIGIVPSDSALWLTHCFYQFFIIDMAKYDIEHEYNSRHLNFIELEKPEDVLKSFAHFRRGIELLLAKIALPLATFDHTLLKYIKFKSKLQEEYIKEQRILLDVWTTEGFTPNYGSWLTLENSFYALEKYYEFDPSGEEPLVKHYDTYPVLSNFFVALFADEAAKILKNHRYSFIKEHGNGQRYFNNFLKIDTLLDFFCKDFPNVVAHKLISLLSDSNSPSSKGWQIYTTVNEIARNYAINSNSGIDYNFSKLIDLIFNDHKSWINWYSNIVNSSKVYSHWKNEFNLTQSLITYDELNDLFDKK
ncbi:hypothetical protein [Ligilactobacillus salivarius]|uniref:hypothetical protein n=1 Tax=Ligilactobacillus salivarius TaxID=1624 RepID=UPI0025A36935|nr:hypothetical protein [Ligilactobacillus salivarius]MDM8284887.1 hypothetical protein [Ligilactobacillus salivarius]